MIQTWLLGVFMGADGECFPGEVAYLLVVLLLEIFFPVQWRDPNHTPISTRHSCVTTSLFNWMIPY